MTQKTLDPRVEADKKVERMIKTWDIVRCNYCGKQISMLNAKSVKNGQYFICKGH